MKRVTGIGGIFFRCEHPDKLREWYLRHLGIDHNAYGFCSFVWDGPGSTQWAPFPENTDYFGPGKQQFMINYRVADLHGLLDELRKEGVTIAGEPHEDHTGKFAWVVDPEGNRVELWEPPDASSIRSR